MQDPHSNQNMPWVLIACGHHVHWVARQHPGIPPADLPADAAALQANYLTVVPACTAAVQVYLASQCHLGELHPELYRSGYMAMQMGVEAGPQMTPECAVVKMMLCLCHPDIPLGLPLAGEL